MNQIIFEKVKRQTDAAQGGGYSNEPGYQIWYRPEGSNEMFFLAYILDHQYTTAVWFYQQEQGVELKYMDSTK